MDIFFCSVDEGHIVPVIDDELENGLVLTYINRVAIYLFYFILEYATRVPYRPQMSPGDVVESSSPTGSSRVSMKQQRQQSPYPSEQAHQQTGFYPSPPPPPPPPPLAPSSFNSSSPHHRHLPTTSTPSSSPSSPHSPLPTSRPTVIMNKGMHHHQQPHYHPYRQYDCNTFVQQHYSLPTTPAVTTGHDQWYFQPPNITGDNFSMYHHPHHHHHSS